MFTCQTCGTTRLSSAHIDSCEDCDHRVRRSDQLLREIMSVSGQGLPADLRLQVTDFLDGVDRYLSHSSEEKLHVEFEEAADKIQDRLLSGAFDKSFAKHEVVR